MKRILLLSLVLSGSLALSAQLFTVTAPSGLSLRATPGIGGERIGKLPFGGLVYFVQSSGETYSLMDEGKEIAGEWVQVYWVSADKEAAVTRIGYVFDGYLQEKKLEKGYTLVIPDTVALKTSMIEGGRYSMAYEYLWANYDSLGSKYELTYNEYNPSSPCAFRHDFTNGLSYSRENCTEEGGSSEALMLPMLPYPVVKTLIDLLFHESGNSWMDPLSYGVDGAGCYYEIIPSEEGILIDIYCGC
ncbi:MAG: SH3 domain-containing protein [Bacteroidota bacterium]